MRYRIKAEEEYRDGGIVPNHIKPDREAIKANIEQEPEGERIRAALERFLKRHKIVGVMLDTDEHSVEISSAYLPDHIRPVLTKWGSIYVRECGGSGVAPEKDKPRR